MDLEALISRLREAVARYGLPVVVHLVYPDGRTELLTLPESSMADSTSDAKAEAVTLELTDREKAVLGVLARAERPLKGRTIATRAGIRYNSHFRDVMSGLRERKLVIADDERRYWPANRPLPAAEGGPR